MEKKEEKLASFLKDKHNLIFIGILILAIAIRLYYFNVTYDQPLWWDEADYLAYAKNLAGYPIDWIVTSKHNSLYPYLAGAIFGIGFKGRVKISQEVMDTAKKSGLDIHILKTPDALKKFQELARKGRKAVAHIHVGE